VTFNGVPLGWEVAFKLIKVFDKDQNGAIGKSLKETKRWQTDSLAKLSLFFFIIFFLMMSSDFFEYAAMHKFLSTLQNAFFAGDRDRSGRLNASEIHTALATAGFTVSLPVLRTLMNKYDKTGYGITFQEFLMVCSMIGR